MSLTKVSAVSIGGDRTHRSPILDASPSLSPPERKFRRATDCRPAFRVMSLLRSSSTAYVIPPTFAPLPGPHSGAAVIAAFLLGSSFAEVVAERRREVPPSLAIQFSRCRGDKRFCQIQLDRTAAPVLDCLQQISYRLSNRCQYNIAIEPCQDRLYLKIY